MKFSKADGLFTAGILAGIALLSVLLYFHSRERSTGSGKVIGKVFYKREIAMRKFSDRMVWEDVESGSALYSHDAVMTGNLSDAELVLDTGLKLRLEANTLVELDLEDSGLNLRLSGGGIKTAGVQTSQTLVTTKGGQTVNVTDGAAAIRTQGGQVAVEVKEGKIDVTQKDGKKDTLAKDEIITAGKKSRVALVVESPAEDAIFLASAPTGKIRIQCDPGAEARTAEVSRSADFSGSSKYTLRQGQGTVNLAAGDWLLRCAGENSTSSLRRFRVVNAGAYKVYRPEKDDITFDDKPVLRLEFKPPHSVGSTRVEVADNASFSNPVFVQATGATQLQVPLPKAGKFFYRLSPAAAPGDSAKLFVQMPPYVASVKLLQGVQRSPLAFVSLNAPVFPLSQVAAGKAFVSFEGSSTAHRVQIFKHGETAPVYSGEQQPGVIAIPANLAGGKYEIRLSAGAEKAVMAFEVRDKIKVDLIEPGEKTLIYLKPGEKTAAVPVAWKSSEDAQLFQVVLAEDADFRHVLKKTNVEGRDFRVTGLTPGKYYLKVLALENNIPRAETAAGVITIEEKLPAVAGLFPRPAQEVDVTRVAGLKLRWEPVSGANSYEIKIFQRRNGGLVLVDARTTRGPALTVEDFKKYKEGDVIWEVRAQHTDRQGRVVQRSEPARSTVNLSFGPALPAPEIVPTISE